MKLQIASQLGIYALLELLAIADRPLTVAEIGSKHRASSHHLAKVMKVLVRAGLVRSVRGAGGGYQFCGNARRITMLEVVELFERLGPGDESDSPGAGTREGRALRAVLGEIDNTARATLGSITLATLRELVRRQEPGHDHRSAAREPSHTP